MSGRSTKKLKNFEQLKNARENILRIDQREMAEKIGINRSYLSQMENDRVDIKPWVMERLEAVLREAQIPRVEISTSAQHEIREQSARYPGPAPAPAGKIATLTITIEIDLFFDGSRWHTKSLRSIDPEKDK